MGCAESYRSRRAQIRKKTTSADGKPKRAARKALRVPADGRIPQAQAKQFMPPQSFVWKARVEQSWKSRKPPYKEVSRSWRTFGGGEALLLVVRDAWEKHCVLIGMSMRGIPVIGLFPAAPSVGAGGASSSSSASA